MTTPPKELTALRTRMAELGDLHSIGGLLAWDQQTVMPPAGGIARADQAATLARVIHGRETDPGLGALLDALEPWAAAEDPDSHEARLVVWARRDFEKATRVPADLAADLTRAQALGQQDWQAARAANDFGPFRDALARHVELRHRYVACFEGHEHPYDALLDDYEPGLTTAELRPLFAELREALVPLVQEAGGDPAAPRNDGVFAGPHPVDQQRAAVLDLLDAVGYDPDAWRLDPALHPFAAGIAPGDVRLTTRYDEHDFAMALYSVLHEFGHGLYEAGADPELHRTTLDHPVSLGVHESQSRLWENVIGRSRPFCGWLVTRLAERLPAGIDGAAFYHAVNTVQPSLIRVEADETTYNLHVILRFELELALVEGTLAVDEAPDAWNEKTEALLGLPVPGPVEGILQDIHWASGAIGYFPTYTLGNLMAAQLWERLARDLDGVEEQLARGEFGDIREWLHLHIHRHGRKFLPRELLRRVTGDDLRTEPFLGYLRGKLADAGVLAGAR